MARLLLGVLACIYGGSLLASVLHYTSAGGKASPWLVFPLAAAAFAALGGALALLGGPWRLEHVMGRLVGTLACLYGGITVGAFAQALAGPSKPSTGQFLISTLSFQGAAVFLVARLLREHETGWRAAFGLDWRRGPAVWLGIIVGICFLPVGWELRNVSVNVAVRLGINPVEQQAVKLIRETVSWAPRLAEAAAAVLLAPLGEELVFRGVLYRFVREAGYPRLALWGTSALFAAIHVNAVAFAPLFALALVLTVLYERTGNLLAPIIAHSIFNAVELVGLFLSS